ncbi:1420_t:CDS:2 [Racocetra fulgida]|uniref:1420_t:CDS:1 n=1 Tax=Racocetra fulgida TaxID=60492 RepID=A0A9N8Z7L2_9GLOM|nr:1420_t:CDS:2 [Racocetra fulgida]
MTHSQVTWVGIFVMAEEVNNCNTENTNKANNVDTKYTNEANNINTEYTV